MHGEEQAFVQEAFDTNWVSTVGKNIDEIIDGSSLQLIGIVPESDDLRLLSLKHKISSRSKALKAFMRITSRLCGEKLLLPKLKKI